MSPANIVLAGIVASVAVGGLPVAVRAPASGGEAQAIGTLRSIGSAQRAYASSCGGGRYATTLTDLVNPPRGGSAGFINPDVETRAPGYEFRVDVDRAGDVTTTSATTCHDASRSLASSFFASADPMRVGAGRHFAVDARGVIFVSAGAIANPIVESDLVRRLQ